MRYGKNIFRLTDYVLSGTQYWKYDSAAEIPVSSDYPKSLSTWNGLPSQIDGAFQWKNGKTFFFSGPDYYRFNDNKFSVEVDYPRPSNVWWFGCGPESKKDYVSSSNNFNNHPHPVNYFWPFKRSKNLIQPLNGNDFEDPYEELNDAIRNQERLVSVTVENRHLEVSPQMTDYIINSCSTTQFSIFLLTACSLQGLGNFLL